MRTKLIGLNARFTHSCLALFYLRNELEQNCASIEIAIDQYTINDPYYELLLNISDPHINYYFFSAYIWNNSLIERIISDLLSIYPASWCIVGGPQAEVVIQAISKENCVAVIGEIERIDPQFYKDMEQGGLQPRYSGRKGRSEFSAPYRDTDFNSHLKNRHIYYETSRGCPFSCTYCLSSAEKGIFHKSVDQVISELQGILKFNPQVVRFVDRTFNDNKDRALAIWQWLAEQDCDTVFHFEISPDRFTEEMFAFLKNLAVGKFQFEIGIQSTHRKTLEAVKRLVDTKSAHETISRLSSFNNIHLHVDLILGLPFENKQSFLRSFKEVFAMRPQYIQMGLLKILPDTPIYHAVSEFEYVYSATPPYSVFANKWLDSANMQELYWFCECVEKFYNNRYFSSFWEHLRNSSEEIVGFFQKLLHTCHHNSFFHQSPTQELLIAMLLEATHGRDDFNYIVELLRYDWLRCGHRFLNKYLQVEGEKESRLLKKMLYNNLAECRCSLTTEAEKMYFLKKGYVVKFSPQFLRDHGYGVAGVEHFLCFVSDREQTLQHYSKAALFSLPG